MDITKTDEVGISSSYGDYEDDTVEKSFFKNLNKTAGYLTPKARLAFTQLKKVFTKAAILQHFDPKSHILIETDTLSYGIDKVPSQLNLDNLGQWHLITYYLQKIIPTKTWYKTHNNELLAIVEAFKI